MCATLRVKYVCEVAVVSQSLAQATFLYITARATGASIDATARLLQAEATPDAKHVLPGGQQVKHVLTVREARVMRAYLSHHICEQTHQGANRMR